MAKQNPKPNQNDASSNGRLEVQKTYKLYIGGKFPRTESGRYYNPQVKGKSLGNICLASRKDVRNAIVAARAAQPNWWSMTAYNRGQILYRIAEMLEGRAEQFASELRAQGLTPNQAQRDIGSSIDRLIYYSGWCDKYQQIFSSVNPVASSHFNFSILEPTGVVFLVASEDSPLLGLISTLTPIVAGGNTCVVIASESKPLSAITFAEVLQTSDVPGGVINILTGRKQELVEHFSKHLDVNAVAYDGKDRSLLTNLRENAASNVKRICNYQTNWSKGESASPYLIRDFCELKTTWHPIEKISESGSGY